MLRARRKNSKPAATLLCPNSSPYGKDGCVLTLCENTGMCQDDCDEPSMRQFPFGVQFYNNGSVCQDSQDAEVLVGDKAFWEEFTIEKILSSKEKQSASESVISFGIHNKSKRKIVVKTFIEDIRATEEVASLLYELKVYEGLRQLSRAVPHFVQLVAPYTYQDQDIPKTTKKLFKELEQDSQSDPKYLKYHFTVSTRVEGPSLETFLSVRRPTIVIKSVLFQLLFCLHAMNMLGFQHNDLHFQNVLVKIPPECDSGTYYVENRVFKVPIVAKVYIYDFDLSACAQCGPNTGLDTFGFCKKFGVCNERNPRFDLFTIMSYIEDINVQFDPEIIKIINFALGQEKIEQKFDFRMCDLQGNECHAFKPDQPKSVKTPVDVLLNMFNEFQKK